MLFDFLDQGLLLHLVGALVVRGWLLLLVQHLLLIGRVGVQASCAAALALR